MLALTELKFCSIHAPVNCKTRKLQEVKIHFIAYVQWEGHYLRNITEI
jgi:hypothetical protein